MVSSSIVAPAYINKSCVLYVFSSSTGIPTMSPAGSIVKVITFAIPWYTLVGIADAMMMESLSVFDVSLELRI